MNKPTFTIQDSMQRKIKYENYKFIFENNIYVKFHHPTKHVII
ncbi:hypothetical protein F989_00772 [Acinetobacter parvus NIPH 1103]|uniref:Uncharacterized protein n=1 Tax=Acinetobacter parvus NIPH 1103 TaxID=1217671 RepID=N8RL71_9GAMM|nr:hypothetical protein F989_00772 [Acinetobacter parvus NIPH 1103]